MKKKIMVLGMIAALLCMMFGTVAMAAEADPAMVEYMTQTGEGLVEQIVEIYNSGEGANFVDDPVAGPALDSYKSATETMGDYIGIQESSAVMDGDIASITVKFSGSQRNGVAKITIDTAAGEISAISFEAEKTFGELMTNAGLNTLLGMGTVFAVLILISVVIACFNYIPNIAAMFSKKEKAPADNAKAVETAVAQIEAVEENLADDLELVAVISAAIAAAEGTTTDGFVVRSIRRATAVRGARF